MYDSPSMTDWRERFPDAERVVAMEGGAVYSAAGEGAWWLITDEVDMLDGERHVAISRFDDELEWQRAITAKRGMRTRFVGERALVDALPKIAASLERMAKEEGLAYVTDQRHLQPLSCDHLTAVARSLDPRLEVGAAGRLDFPEHFPRVGAVDITLAFPDADPLYIELKCGSGTNALGNCAWDLVKMALTVQMGTTPGAYLLAATREVDWAGEIRGAEFFKSAPWRTQDVREKYADWFRDYEKRNDPQPARLPASGSTVALGEAGFEVAGSLWILRLSRVEVDRGPWFEWKPLIGT